MPIDSWNELLADHQRAAVQRTVAILRQYRGCLLADETGLGKSFVAAAVARTYANDGVEIELIVPCALVDQWTLTLQRFGVAATIRTHTGISGIPFVPQPERRRLVIVDEAHGFRNPATRRYDALARRTIAASVLLISATPLCNRQSDLHALLALLVPDDALMGRGVPSIDLAFVGEDLPAIATLLDELMVRRDTTVLPDALRFGHLVRRFVRYPVTDSPEVAAGIDDLRFPLANNPVLLRQWLWRRLESSEEALLETIRRQRRFYQRAVESLARGRLLDRRAYRAAFGGEEDAGAFQQVLFWELWSASPADGRFVPAIQEEMERLDRLEPAVVRCPSRKRELLMKLAGAIDRPALVFTFSAATARMLGDALQTTHSTRVVTSRDRGDASRIFSAFREGRFDILVCTDLAAEGLDLQRAGVVIHYDLPWNPVKVDQRNGRAFRIGQTRPAVLAVLFVPERGGTRILATIARKNQIRRQLLSTGSRLAAGPALLRPRLTRDAAAVRLLSRIGEQMLPEAAERRQKAGVERLLEEMSREVIDRERLRLLLSILNAEASL